jgi:molybdate transport system substrate-binding protein
MTGGRDGRRALCAALAMTVAIVLAGHGPAGAAAAVIVFAASDLAFAFKELLPRFEKALGVKVTLVLGSTGQLSSQIEHGAPADVFFAADRSFIDRLAERGVVIAETRARYAQGRLALAASKAAGKPLADLRDLVGPDVRRVALANPLHAPYGRAAEQAMRATGIWDRVKPKLVYGEHVRQALQFLQAGSVDAAVIPLSLTGVSDVTWVPVDPRLHAPLDQDVAVVRRSAHPELGLALIQFLGSGEGRAVMKRYGFRLPGEF